MSLSRFAVTSPFSAWRPEDRDHPERRLSIVPGVKHLFTDEPEPSGVFVKFLKSGSWYEAERSDFALSTAPVKEDRKKQMLIARRGA
jgi:hypothetical protein